MRSESRFRQIVPVLLAVAVLIAAAGCGTKKDSAAGAGSGSSGAASCGTVTINEASWVGSTANVYVAKNILENKLGCTVDISQIAEIPVYQAMADGKVDVVLEDWQHTPQYAKYEDQLGVVQDAGSLGVTGHIGWYVPKYVMDAHPELATSDGLKQDWAMFKTAESGDQGQMLDGDPSYVTNDESLIKTLGYNLKVVYAGGEASEIAAIKQAYAQKKPLLFYWYTPQWLNATIDLSEVKLPDRTTGCDSNPDKVSCAYPDYDLRKLMSTKFAQSGSPAVQFVKNFQWTNEDQEAVAVLIADKHMTPDDAAAQWVSQNQDKVNAWLNGVS
jgi:glycine betaine/proline transport system substrate-binding protein